MFRALHDFSLLNIVLYFNNICFKCIGIAGSHCVLRYMCIYVLESISIHNTDFHYFNLFSNIAVFVHVFNLLTLQHFLYQYIYFNAHTHTHINLHI